MTSWLRVNEWDGLWLLCVFCTTPFTYATSPVEASRISAQLKRKGKGVHLSESFTYKIHFDCRGFGVHDMALINKHHDSEGAISYAKYRYMGDVQVLSAQSIFKHHDNNRERISKNFGGSEFTISKQREKMKSDSKKSETEGNCVKKSDVDVGNIDEPTQHSAAESDQRKKSGKAKESPDDVGRIEATGVEEQHH
uniref:Yippee domain-containing protein n=1 Tax=Angiostrongylus cantonensis TaxID=6313 RepID=A0A0K0DAQ2_ANGCA